MHAYGSKLTITFAANKDFLAAYRAQDDGCPSESEMRTADLLVDAVVSAAYRISYSMSYSKWFCAAVAQQLLVLHMYTQPSITMSQTLGNCAEHQHISGALGQHHHLPLHVSSRTSRYIQAQYPCRKR